MPEISRGSRSYELGVNSNPPEAFDRPTTSKNRVERVTGTIKEIQAMTGWTRSRVYLALASGEIRAVKDGKRVLVIVDSVRTYIDSLPRAEYRAKP